MDKHEHDKVYANTMLPSYPPQIPWICRSCLVQGADRVEYGDVSNREYEALVRKAQIKRESITLRNATMEDAITLYDWRNHPTTRAMMRQEHLITWEMHRQWLRDVLEDPNRLLYLAMMDGQAVGTVRFDLPSSPDNLGLDAEVSVTVSPQFRGMGIGSRIIELGTERALLTCSRVIARVKPNNTASIKVFTHAGYSEVSRTDNEVSLLAERSA